MCMPYTSSRLCSFTDNMVNELRAYTLGYGKLGCFWPTGERFVLVGQGQLAPALV